MFNRGNNGGMGSSGENTGDFAETFSVESQPRTRSDTSECCSQKKFENNNIITSAGIEQQGLHTGYISSKHQQVNFFF